MDKYLAIGLLLFTSTTMANDIHSFYGFGISRYDTPANKYWWQNSFESDKDMRPQNITLGLEKSLNTFISVRASYFDLGKYQIEALATPDEDKLTGVSSAPCGAYKCKDPDLYVTQGSIRGFTLSGVIKLPAKFSPYIEAGISGIRQDFKLKATGINPGSQYGVGKSFTYQEHLYGAGYMTAIGMSYKNLFVSAKYHTSRIATDFNNGVFPSGVNSSYSIQVGSTF